MSVSSVSQTSSSSLAGAQGAAAVSFDETKTQFLQMLITQLKNQDPFAPQDSTQFAQQMMQMGQMEQLMNINSGMTQLVAAQQGSIVSQYTDLVGKTVQAQGSTVELIQGQGAELNFEIPEVPKGSVGVNIFNQSGDLVRRLDTGISERGAFTLVYDGKDKNGAPLPDGYYNYTVQAQDADDNLISVNTYSQGRISSVRMSEGTPVLQMGSRDLGMSEIKRIF